MQWLLSRCFLTPAAALLKAGQSRTAWTGTPAQLSTQRKTPRPERAPGCQECVRVWAPPAFPDCEVGRFCTYVLAHTCFCSNLDSQNSCSASKSSGFQVNPPHSNPGPVLWLQSGTGGRGTSDDLTAIPMGSQQPVCQRHLTNRKEKQSFYFCSVPSLANPVMCLITITF